MWGNRLGWILSVLIVLATVAGMLWIDAAGRRFSRPDAYGLDPANSAALSLPDPTLVVPSMTGDADASALYRQLIDRTLAALPAVEQFARAGRAGETRAIRPVLEPMLAAAGARRASVFASSPGELINYDNAHPGLSALELAGKAALRAALVEPRTRTSDARRTLEAVFALGHRLFEERLTYEELDLGLRLMAESAAALRRLAEQDELDPAARVASIDGFDRPRLVLARDRVLPIAARIRTLDGRVVAANAGNVMHWAKHAGDRVWRVEAILAVGRLRYFVGTEGKPGDAAAAARTLEELASDPDPVIQAAVRAAASLTQEQFRSLR